MALSISLKALSHVPRDDNSGAKIPVKTKFDFTCITEAATNKGDRVNLVVKRVVRRIHGKTHHKSEMSFDAEAVFTLRF